MGKGLFASVSQLSDEEWLEALLAGGHRRLNDVDLPRLPPISIQRRSSGTLGDDSLRGGHAAYTALKSAADRHGRPVTPDSVILDFGCGWGRVLRFFLKDVPGTSLFGVDIDAEAVRSCNEAIPTATVTRNREAPPLSFDDDSFDLIYAYSVFSHLPEKLHLQWVAELTRCLKPGGVFVATTQARSFLATCREMQRQGNLDQRWQQEVVAGFPDLDSALADYDSGKYVFAPLPRPTYGHTLIPRRYLDQNWSHFLDVREFSTGILPQAMVVAQKRG